MPRVLPAVLMAAAAAFPAHAADWGQLATISSTLGVNANRLCVGEGTRSDIGCPSYAPELTSSGLLLPVGISVTTTHGISSTNGYFSGNVGIGTTTPQKVLHVNGPLVAKANGSGSWPVSGVAMYLERIDNGALFPIIQYGSNVLHIGNAGGNYQTGLKLWGGNSLGGDISINPGGATDAVTIRQISGNVGISTTNPNAKLDVYGDISATNLRLSGNLYVSGSQTIDGVTFANGGVSATGIITATSFSGDGSRLTGLASGDRIVSGTTRIIANNNSYVSVTVNGVDVARFNQSQGAVFGANGALNTGYWAGSSVSTTASFLRSGDSFLNIRSTDNAGSSGVIFNGAGYRGAIYGTAGYDMYLSPNDQYRRADVIFMPVQNTNGMNVGINNETPQATLQVSGSFTVSTSAQTTTPSLYVGTNGRIGLGTSSPGSELSIHGVNAQITMTDASATANSGYISFGNTPGAGGNLNIGTTSSGSAYGAVNIASAGAFRVNAGSAGYLIYGAQGLGGYRGILAINSPFPGTLPGAYVSGSIFVASTPSTNPSATLHVAGTGRITSWTTIAANVTPTTELDVYGTISATNILVNGAPITGTADRITSGTTNVIATQDRSVTISTAGTQRVVVGENGNVGIGTTAPSGTLHVLGSVYQTNASGSLSSYSALQNFQNGLAYTGWNGTDQAAELEATSNKDIRLKVTGGTVFVKGTTGNVGIGTTSPQATLQVSGTGRITSWTTIAANVTPTTELDVYGTISATNILVNGAPITATADRITSGTTSAIANNNGAISFTTAGTERMVINSSGNVGIGTTNPTAPLHVSITASTLLNVGNGWTTGNPSATIGGNLSLGKGGTETAQMTMWGGSGQAGNIRFRSSSGLYLYASSLNYIRLAMPDLGSSDGRVGVNILSTTTPSANLHVSGTSVITSRTLIGGTGTPSATFQVSGSLLLAGNDNIPCTDSALGLVRRNPTTGRLQACR